MRPESMRASSLRRSSPSMRRMRVIVRPPDSFFSTTTWVFASEARTHVVVAKEESGGRTITRIRRIEGEERRRELARMLSGRVDEASLAHASELLVGGR